MIILGNKQCINYINLVPSKKQPSIGGSEFYAWNEGSGKIFFTTTPNPSANDVMYEGSYYNGEDKIAYINSNDVFQLEGATITSDTITFEYYGMEMVATRDTTFNGNYTLTHYYNHSDRTSDLPIYVQVIDDTITESTVVYYLGSDNDSSSIGAMKMYKLEQHPTNITETSFEIDGVVYNKSSNQSQYFETDVLSNATVKEEFNTEATEKYFYCWKGDDSVNGKLYWTEVENPTSSDVICGGDYYVNSGIYAKPIPLTEATFGDGTITFKEGMDDWAFDVTVTRDSSNDGLYYPTYYYPQGDNMDGYDESVPFEIYTLDKSTQYYVMNQDDDSDITNVINANEITVINDTSFIYNNVEYVLDEENTTYHRKEMLQQHFDI